MTTIELIPECHITDASHYATDGECRHLGLIKVTRPGADVRWILDPALGDGHHVFISGCLEDKGLPGIVDTRAGDFYVGLAAVLL